MAYIELKNAGSIDEHGDRPRPLPVIEELEKSTDIVERTESPSWDFDEVDGCWKWMKPPPISKYKEYTGNSSGRKRSSSIDKPVLSEAAKKRLRKQYGCPICQQVLDMPVNIELKNLILQQVGEIQEDSDDVKS
ncbi:E3 ubiquitin-protein ligase ORTHRUS 2-like protein [Corchorus olitorius]|uniref:E3 ubiquitin-protein ligase ORTHRUS 2-like protein n=1 Tax=Corchorus olitorius TaxID=93759 RepID=A0A1R3G2M0_9ROSI|nr:E3 ubiquitin-protein ligase ORTHRUS 2-like protein [Corchorus olitorius]